MVFEQKEFTPIKGYEGVYYICKDTSEVLSLSTRKNTVDGTKKILKQVNNSQDPSNNYFIVTLVCPVTGKRQNRAIHRLMCETFLPNPDSKKHVNHKDGNKLNNMLCNLEWATPQENSQHAVDTGLTAHQHCMKKVYQYDKDTLEFMGEYSSDAEAEKATGVAKQNISKVTLGKRNHAGGFFWSRNKL